MLFTTRPSSPHAIEISPGGIHKYSVRNSLDDANTIPESGRLSAISPFNFQGDEPRQQRRWIELTDDGLNVCEAARERTQRRNVAVACLFFFGQQIIYCFFVSQQFKDLLAPGGERAAS
jgi:hypothetical protein